MIIIFTIIITIKKWKYQSPFMAGTLLPVIIFMMIVIIIINWFHNYRCFSSISTTEWD